jgi:hypothetical protein
MGSGFRTFTAGEILTASNVQNYLQDQVVMTFAGSAARSSAIGTANFEEGMTSYLTDTDKMEVYNGTNWVSVAPTTSQGLTLINTTSFSGVASQSINDVFSATYDNYRIVLQLTVATGGANIFGRLRVSGTDTTTNYQSAVVFVPYAASTTVTGVNAVLGTTGLFFVNEAGSSVVDLFSPFLTQQTRVNGLYQGPADGSYVASKQTSSTSFTGITFYPSAGTITGTVSIYGYNK